MEYSGLRYFVTFLIYTVIHWTADIFGLFPQGLPFKPYTLFYLVISTVLGMSIDLLVGKKFFQNKNT